MDEDKEKEEAEETENENLRELILQQLATLESSETSDDDSYKVRLSCILEDDESESSGAAQKEAGRNKESEKGPPEGVSESETSDSERVQITDLDDVTLCEKTEHADNASDTTNEESDRNEGFAIKKLKSSDNVPRRPFVVRRRELSSDSSDLDTSVTNSAEGHSSDLKIVEVSDEDEEKTLNLTGEGYVESEEEEVVAIEKEKVQGEREREGTKGIEMEKVDNETLAPIFAKVSRTYLEKTKSNVKWEENEKIDFVFKELVEEVKKARATGQLPGDHLSLQDVHIRGTSPRVYDPPVPPETYLWEELKRLRERGGYPWTYLDKPPFDEATWKKYMEHVYEPINPPPLSTEMKAEAPQPPTPEVVETHAPQVSTIPEPEKQFKRIPSKASLSKKESVEESKTSDDMEEENAQEFQDLVESRYLAPTPTTASETTASASKTDVTSTVLDTSEFEDQPVKQGNFVKTRKEQMRARATEIQQRLRNHAGRIRNKFSNIQKPGRRERPKREPGERRFKLPEMHAPKISLPDKSKFKLPESAKLHFPDRSKFHLPERPKFGAIAERMHLPERGKFHLPDRSKFHLPDRSKFHLPDRSKFHLPEKARFHLPDKSKFHLPNRPKIELPRFRRASASETSPTGEKSKFELKSYPKLFTKHSKDYTTSSPKQTRGRTPPPRMQQQQQQQQQTSQKWTEKLDKLKYADDDVEGVKETDSRKSESLFEKDGYMEDMEGVPTLSTKSSMSEMSEERKKGVLEEINPDEFFLRQKGISQDDIDVGQYLSREIREAFRSPDVNALAKMDYDDENIEPRYRGQPSRPQRTSSIKKKSILKKSSTSDPSLADDGYKTYPPRRPGRKSRSQSKSLLNEEAIVAETSPAYEADVNVSRYDNDDVNFSRYDNVDDDELSEYYKTPGPAKEYQHYKVPRSHAPVLAAEEELERKAREDWEEEEMEMKEPPKPAARRKQKKKAAEVESIGEEQLPQETSKETEVVPEALPLESPIPPKRTRTRSSGSRSLRSFPTVSDINQSFHSEPAREHPESIEDEIVAAQVSASQRSPMVEDSQDFISYEITDLDDPGFGYATVGKPTVTKPERKKKPERPPPPRRRKEVSVPVYNTYPRRAPVRPLRNYSTLGPSRPPRQKKVPPIERTLSERQFKAYAELKSHFDDDVIEIGSCKELQTEKVIEKMKGRPLPPPPRPPRQKSKGPEEDLEQTEDERLSLSILKDEEFPIERKVQAFVHEPPPNTDVEEVCVSTQTDPLPEDFSFGTEESDVMPEFSHEQLKIQQAFLEEMKKEEEEMRQRRGEGDMVDAELKAEVIRQIEDIIAEEKRILERKNEERMRRSETGPDKEEKSYLDVEPDMGYASLDRRGHRQEPAPAAAPSVTAQQLPTKMDKLQVAELEVGTLNVHEVQSDQIFVKELQGNRIVSHDIDNTGGTMSVGTMEIPPALIDQIVSKIPWDALRQSQEQPQDTSPPVRPQRRQRGLLQDSDEDLPQTRRTHRRHHRAVHSSDEEEKRSRRPGEGRGSKSSERSIPELSLQLARACTSASVQAVRNIVQTNASIVQSMDRELCVQLVLCIAIALIAGFFLFGFDAKIVHLHKWDFQFPPQPPAGEF